MILLLLLRADGFPSCFLALTMGLFWCSIKRNDFMVEFNEIEGSP